MLAEALMFSVGSIVDREKRILYEEREAGPRVSFALPDGVNADVEEGDTVNVEIRLSEALEEDVSKGAPAFSRFAGAFF